MWRVKQEQRSAIQIGVLGGVKHEEQLLIFTTAMLFLQILLLLLPGGRAGSQRSSQRRGTVGNTSDGCLSERGGTKM